MYLNRLKGKELVLLEYVYCWFYKSCLSIERLGNSEEVVVLYPEIRPIVGARSNYLLEQHKLT